MDRLPISAIWKAKITRVDGSEEYIEEHNLVVDAGMDWLAGFLSGTGSAMIHVAVGSGTTAASLNQTALVAETARKEMGSKTSSENVWISVTTFGGDADSVTSVALTEAGVFNHASSGEGTMFQRLQSTLATLGNSDFLQLTIETTLGSRSS